MLPQDKPLFIHFKFFYIEYIYILVLSINSCCLYYAMHFVLQSYLCSALWSALQQFNKLNTTLLYLNVLYKYIFLTFLNHLNRA